AECSRVLKPNGAFWISHSRPCVLLKLSAMVEQCGRGLVNWITWDKYNGATATKGFMDGFTVTGSMRSFQPMAEYLVFHADDGEWRRACGQLWSVEFEHRRGFIFEPLRAYLDDERKRAGIDKADCNVACGFSRSAGGMASRHYFGRSQWQLPTCEHYESLRRLFNNLGGDYLRREYDDLRREYDNLRREYEHLRYTFNNPGKISSVWQCEPAKPNGHPTAKPAALMARIIEATSNPGDIVLDPFCGSGTTAEQAAILGRHWIGIEIDETYCCKARARLRDTEAPLFAEAT
ncbi:MAG TPA: DNA methyltransferase, partial [Phycisphaerae bacterium]|nr:DNA methyltransferase [Phycisphaerae bacterium]